MSVISDLSSCFFENTTAEHTKPTITVETDKIFAIHNTNNSNAYIYDKTDLLALTKDQTIFIKIKGLIKSLLFILKSLFTRISHRHNYSSSIQDSTSNPKALLILLHGLHDHPSAFDGYHDAFKKKYGDKITIFQPHVHKKGVCTLKEATDPVLKEISTWAKKHKDTPILLCGVSNGARMVGDLVTRLKTEKAVSNPIKASSIAGPFYGSKMANQPGLSKTWQNRWKNFVSNRFFPILGKKQFEEFSWGSSFAKNLIDKMRKVADKKLASFDFYTTTSDCTIRDFTSALPCNIKNAGNFVIKNAGHNDVVASVQKHLTSRCIEFIDTSKN